MAKNAVDLVVRWLLIIGGLNWGLVGLLDLNLVAYLPAILAKIVYILVGVAAVYKLVRIVTKKKK